jgi:hypothetical protein
VDPALLRWMGSYQKDFFVFAPLSIESSRYSGGTEVQSDRPKAWQKSVPENDASASMRGGEIGDGSTCDNARSNLIQRWECNDDASYACGVRVSLTPELSNESNAAYLAADDVPVASAGGLAPLITSHSMIASSPGISWESTPEIFKSSCSGRLRWGNLKQSTRIECVAWFAFTNPKSARYRALIVRKPGRGLCQNLPLLLELAVLAPQPREPL